MSLPCGCEPSLEGGYGDDGTHGRYSMGWCNRHAAVEELIGAVTWLLPLAKGNTQYYVSDATRWAIIADLLARLDK